MKHSWSLSHNKSIFLGMAQHWSQELRVATRRDRQQRAKLDCSILLRFHSDGFVRWSIESQYIYLRTVSSLLLFSFGTFDSFLLGLAAIECMVHVACCSAQKAQTVHKPELVHQSRQQLLRAYSPNVYTVYRIKLITRERRRTSDPGR